MCVNLTIRYTHLKCKQWIWARWRRTTTTKTRIVENNKREQSWELLLMCLSWVVSTQKKKLGRRRNIEMQIILSKFLYVMSILYTYKYLVDACCLPMWFWARGMWMNVISLKIIMWLHNILKTCHKQNRIIITMIICGKKSRMNEWLLSTKLVKN